MVTKESLESYIQDMTLKGYGKPIFEIMLFRNPNKELVYSSGKPAGFPDLGSSDISGFYYDLDDAIKCMNGNSCDIREHIYGAGFILCRFPGLYNPVGTDGRMYFVWDEEKEGFFQQEEPEIFDLCAY